MPARSVVVRTCQRRRVVAGRIVVSVRVQRAATEDSRMPRRAKNASPSPAESHAPTATEGVPLAEAERERGRPSEAQVETLYLPTLILPQTLLLPHMSLPYPL